MPTLLLLLLLLHLVPTGAHLQGRGTCRAAGLEGDAAGAAGGFAAARCHSPHAGNQLIPQRRV